MTQRLYLDNAATSFPKPPEVMAAMRTYMETLGASAGRGAYREALATGELVAECRALLARLIHAPQDRSVVFTHNGSASLNLALKGVLRPGDHVVTTTMEHNSVLRPLNALGVQREVDVTHVAADSRSGLVDTETLIGAIRPNTRLVAVNHGSNVTGSVQPILEIGAATSKRSVLLLVDGAQTAGHVPIDVQAMNIDLLALPGHKGLMGPPGTGALYIRPSLDDQMEPLIEGGTGSVSEQPVQPDFLPDKFEAGSHNAVGLAGLAAGLRWIGKKSLAALKEHDQALSRRFLERIRGIAGLTLYGPTDPALRVAVFSVRVQGFEPAELSAVLETEFGLLTRSGIHCAPLAHQTIGTHDDGGTTRLSFGAFNTLEEADRVADSLLQLVASNSGAQRA